MNVLILTEDFVDNIEQYVKEQQVDFDELVIKTTEGYLKILFKKDGVVLLESKSFNLLWDIL